MFAFHRNFFLFLSAYPSSYPRDKGFSIVIALSRRPVYTLDMDTRKEFTIAVFYQRIWWTTTKRRNVIESCVFFVCGSQAEVDEGMKEEEEEEGGQGM